MLMHQIKSALWRSKPFDPRKSSIKAIQLPDLKRCLHDSKCPVSQNDGVSRTYSWLIERQISIIMASQKTKNIQIADILANYGPKALRSYSINDLKEELHQIRDLFGYLNPNNLLAIDAQRKESKEIEQMVDLVYSSAQLAQQQFLYRLSANHELAYRILSMSAARLIPRKAKPKMIRQLRLKFLQSNNVTLGEWQCSIRQQSNSLAVHIPQRNAQVIVGIQQKGITTEIQWAIREAFLAGQRNLQLFEFLMLFYNWSAKNNQQCQINFIGDLKMLLFNLPTIVLYLQLRRIWKSQKQQQIVTYSKQDKEGKITTFQWQFDFFSSLLQPRAILSINGKRVATMAMKGTNISGQLNLLSGSEMQEEFIIGLKEDKIPNFHYFAQFPSLFQKLENRLIQFNNKNQGLVNLRYQIIISAANFIFCPCNLQSNKITQKLPFGVWIYIPIEKGCLLFVEQQGSLSDREDPTLISLLMQKGAKLPDIASHTNLHKQILLQNCGYQYQLYDCSIDESNEQIFVSYQFRCIKFCLNQRFNTTTPAQQSFIVQGADFHLNYLIRVKISLDFTKALFEAGRFHEGKRFDKLEEDAEKYLRNGWKQYKEQLTAGERHSWIAVAEEIEYLRRAFAMEMALRKNQALRPLVTLQIS